MIHINIYKHHTLIHTSIHTYIHTYMHTYIEDIFLYLGIFIHTV